MDEKDIHFAVRKMIELYGDDAEIVAAARAESHATGGQIEASAAWESIATMICELQHKKKAAG